MSDPFKEQAIFDQEMKKKYDAIWSKHVGGSKDVITRDQLAFQYFKNGYVTRINEEPLIKAENEAMKCLVGDVKYLLKQDHGTWWQTSAIEALQITISKLDALHHEKREQQG